MGFDSVHFNISQIPDVFVSLLAQGCSIALAVILKRQKIKSSAVRYQSRVLLDNQMIYQRTSSRSLSLDDEKA